MAIRVLLSFAFIGYTMATNGVDVSSPVSVDAWKCLKKAGNNFAIVRVYQSNGKIDPNGAQTIKNAHAAQIPHVDGYIFPCHKCGDPKGQIRSTVNHLKQQNAQIGQLWLDVEGPKFWSQNNSDNVRFIQGLVDEANTLKVKVAMYTSESQWKPITKDNKNFGKLPLWYAHYDNQQNFNDFKPFGGWQKPAIKQFVGTTTICKVSLDRNWYP